MFFFEDSDFDDDDVMDGNPFDDSDSDDDIHYFDPFRRYHDATGYHSLGLNPQYPLPIATGVPNMRYRTNVGQKRSFDQIQVWEEKNDGEVENIEEDFDHLQDKIMSARKAKKIRLSLGMEEDDGYDSSKTDDLAVVEEKVDEQEQIVHEVPSEINEDIVRAYSLPSEFSEGLDLIHCVQAITLRNNGKLKANIVRASNDIEMITKCTVRIKGKYVVGRTCSSCKDSSHGGILWCKHIVAVLLKCIRSPEAVLHIDTFDNTVRDAERDNYLSEAVIAVLKGNPALMHQLKKEIDRLKKGKHTEVACGVSYTPCPRTVTMSEIEDNLPVLKFSSGHYIDERRIFNNMLAVCSRYSTGSSRCNRATCSCRCHYRSALDSSDDEDDCDMCFSYGGQSMVSVVDTASSYITCATKMIEKGDKQDLSNGLSILESVGLGLLTIDMSSIPPYMSSTNNLEQYDSLIKSLSAGLQVAMLQSNDKITQNQRDHWIDLLPNWNAIVSAMTSNRAKSNFIAALDAAKHGWDSDLIQRVLKGDEIAIALFSESKDIVDTRLKVLVNQKEVEKAYYYAKAVGRVVNATVYLLSAGRMDEALAYAEQNTKTVQAYCGVSLAVMYAVELLLDDSYQSNNFSDRMLEFLNDVEVDEATGMTKLVEHLLNAASKRFELFSKSETEILVPLEESAKHLSELLYKYMKEGFNNPELMRDAESKTVVMKILTSLTEPMVLFKSLLSYQVQSRFTGMVEVPAKFQMLSLMLELFEYKRVELSDFICKLLSGERQGENNMLCYIGKWLIEKHNDHDNGFNLALRGFSSEISPILSKWLCSFASQPKYMIPLVTALTERKCNTSEQVMDLILCSEMITDDLAKFNVRMQALRESLRLATLSSIQLRYEVVEQCLQVAVRVCKSSKSINAVSQLVSAIYDTFNPKLIHSSAISAYIRNDYSNILEIIAKIIDCLLQAGDDPLKSFKLIAYSLVDVAFPILDIALVVKPLSADQQSRCTKIISSLFYGCGCTDCSGLMAWIRTPETSQTRTIVHPACHSLRAVSMSNSYLTVERKSDPTAIVFTKTPALEEAAKVIRTQDQMRRFPAVSKHIVTSALAAARASDGLDTVVPSREDQLLNRIQSQNSTNFAILQYVLDFLLSGHRYERAIDLANRILDLPNESLQDTQEIMRKLIKASKHRALLYKVQFGKEQLFEQSRDSCIQLAKKNFLVSQQVRDFDKVKKLFSKFDMETKWNQEERAMLLTTYLNSVKPEMANVTGTYTYHNSVEIPRCVKVTFHLLIRDFYIKKASEILTALVKRHESHNNAELCCSRFIDQAFSFLTKFRIDQSLIHQFFEPIIKYYGEKWIAQKNFETSTQNYSVSRMYGASTSQESNMTGDTFWSQNAGTSSFERLVIEKWCVPLLPQLAAWFMEKKMNDWVSSINSRRGGYNRVVACFMKVKKCYEMSGKVKMEWDKFKASYLNTKGIKSKKKLVTEINVADSATYQPKTPFEQSLMIKKVQDSMQNYV